MNIKKISNILNKIALSDEKLWTKPEWEAYRKSHPSTKIKPKFSKGDNSSTPKKTDSKKKNIKHELKNKLDDKTKNEIKNIKKDPSKWESFKSKVKDVVKSDGFKTFALHVGQAVATLAVLHYAKEQINSEGNIRRMKDDYHQKQIDDEYNERSEADTRLQKGLVNESLSRRRDDFKVQDGEPLS